MSGRSREGVQLSVSPPGALLLSLVRTSLFWCGNKTDLGIIYARYSEYKELAKSCPSSRDVTGAFITPTSCSLPPHPSLPDPLDASMQGKVPSDVRNPYSSVKQDKLAKLDA